MIASQETTTALFPAKNAPLISVVIPIYNTEKYLDQCLTSIEKQSYQNLEIICLNDGSTDDSLAIIKTHAERDQRYLVIDKENQGYGATCNRGIEEAQGEYISIIEPDDWIEGEMYSEMVAFSSQFPISADIIKVAYWRIWLPDTPRQTKLNCPYKGRIHPQNQPFKISEGSQLLRHHPSIWSALYRREFLKLHNIRFKEYPGAGWADNPFLVETLCQAQSIIYLDKAFYCYREDSPEKSVAFVKSNPLLAFDRWNEMLDIIESLNIVNAEILQAHYGRGFAYFEDIVHVMGIENSLILESSKHLFERMDVNLVFADDLISPQNKECFAKLRGLPPYKTSLGKKLGFFARKVLYNIQTNGLIGTLTITLNFLKRR